jgi:hypothetical protein
MRILDGRGRLLRPTDDGLWIGPHFSYVPPLARGLRSPCVALFEPFDGGVAM